MSYIGHLIWRGLSKEEITVLATDWNQKNQPPLSEEEVAATVNYCYQAYQRKMSEIQKMSQMLHLINLNSVLVETKSYPEITHRHTPFIPESPPPTQAPVESQDPAANWDTEISPYLTMNYAARNALSCVKEVNTCPSSFFCGRWSCPRCGPFFRQRWIEHLTTKTAGTDLYVTEISEDDWPRIRRGINRLEGRLHEDKIR